MMKNIFLYLWQLPQNILGLIIILITQAKKNSDCYETELRMSWGISLGNYIIFSRKKYIHPSIKSILHEKGHQKQSLYLGWFYLIDIGIPSLFGNIIDKLFHGHWNMFDRMKWYYNQPWEKWADKLGNVKRGIEL